MTYPNLFIIGAPKCGMTSLATYLGFRPDVFGCEPKEPHHFSTDIGWNFISDRSAYLKLFKSAPDLHRVVEIRVHGHAAIRIISGVHGLHKSMGSH